MHTHQNIPTLSLSPSLVSAAARKWPGVEAGGVEHRSAHTSEVGDALDLAALWVLALAVGYRPVLGAAADAPDLRQLPDGRGLLADVRVRN